MERTFSQDPKDQQYALTLLQQAIENNFQEYVFQLATVLSTDTNAPYVRKVAGLQLKNTLVSRDRLDKSSFDKNKNRWESLPIDVRDYVKRCVLDSLGTETIRPSTAAQCVAAIAYVEFPTKKWPELIDRLSANVASDLSNPTLKEFSLEALSYICQDIQEKQPVAQILAAIVHGLRMEQSSVHVQLAGTKALSEIVGKVMTRTLEEHVDTIVDITCAYLQTAELNLYEEAAKCLYEIASRKFAKTTETPIVLSLFRDDPMHKILEAASLAAADSSSRPEHYKYLKALCDLLCALGIHLAEVWSYVMKPPPNFSLYLSALTAFFAHPSIYIRAETTNVFATFCGHERIMKNEDFLRYVPNLIQFLPKAMNKSCSPQDGQNLTDQYSRMDYGNDVELQREYIRLRDHGLRLIRESSAQHFDKLLAVIRDWTLNRCVQAPQEVKPDEWEVMKRFITTVLQSSFQLEKATPEVRREYLSLFDAVLQCSVSTPLNGVLSILSSLFPVFGDFPDRIPLALNHFKAILLVDNPNNQDVEITATKRHSIALLLKIVSVYPESVKPFARIVFDLVKEVSQRVSMMQRANLVHVLGALSNLATSADEQTQFLHDAIQYDILYVQQEPFSASPVAFLTSSGLTAAPESAAALLNQNCPHYQSRLNLKASLTALEGVLNQVSVPSDQHSAMLFALFAPVVPKFFQFAKSLNSIYTPEYSAMINPAYGLSVLEMAPSERQTIVSSIAMDVENEAKKTEEFDPGQAANGNGGADMVLFLRKFISEISDLVQSIIGAICARFPNNVYSLPNASELMTGTLYAVESVPNFRLRFWIRKTWGRMASACPEQWANAILPMMATLLNHLQARLPREWAIVKQRQSADEEDEPSEEELIAESTMSLLSREASSFIVNFLLGESFSLKNVKSQSPLPISQISRTLMANREVLLGVVGLLAKLITCPDSQAAIKTLPAVNVLVYEYRSVIDEQTAVQLLVHAIQSLHMYANDELAAGPILTLIFNIYAQLRPNNPALLQVLQQVPSCLPENINSFDQRIITISEVEETKLHDKMKRDLMRKVLTSTRLKGQHHRKASSETNGVEQEYREME